jgi:diaminopimelate decarboxylase
VHHVGAYCVTQSMQFIALRPKVVLIDMDDKVHIIKNNESLEDLEKNEISPGYLVKNSL